MKGNQGLEALAALCGGVSKVDTSKEEGSSMQQQQQQQQQHALAASAIMPPPPAVGVMGSMASSKGIASTGAGGVVAGAAGTGMGVAGMESRAGTQAQAATAAAAFPMMGDLSTQQWQQALFAAYNHNPTAAVPAAPLPPPPNAAATSAMSALLSGLPQGFVDPTSAAMHQLAAYHFMQAQAQAQAVNQAHQQHHTIPTPAPAPHIIHLPPQPTVTPTPHHSPPSQPHPQPPVPPASVPPINMYNSPNAPNQIQPKTNMPHMLPPPKLTPATPPQPQTQTLPAHTHQENSAPPVISPADPTEMRVIGVAQPKSNVRNVSIVPEGDVTDMNSPTHAQDGIENKQVRHVNVNQASSLMPLEPSKGGPHGRHVDAALPAARPTGAPVSVPAAAMATMTEQQPLEDGEGQPAGPAGPLAAAGQVASVEDKKQLKRAANRRSAQLSRKRKKQFIEELKEENDELRRKEQILRSIPDLIVVFDSAGRLWFVSHSVSRFLDYTPQELESSSFWDRLCDESVRLLKAAFMDALAARSQGCDTAPLGSGVWELRLVDRDGSHKLVTLNGVVHFSGDAPECVCSIRPRDDPLQDPATQRITHLNQQRKQQQQHNSGPIPLTNTNANKKQKTSRNISHYPPTHLIRNAIKPQQSVISNASSDDASVKIARGRAPTGQLLDPPQQHQHQPQQPLLAQQPLAPRLQRQPVMAHHHHHHHPGSASSNAAANNNNGPVPPGNNPQRIRAAQISDGDSSVVSESGSDP